MPKRSTLSGFGVYRTDILIQQAVNAFRTTNSTNTLAHLFGLDALVSSARKDPAGNLIIRSAIYYAPRSVVIGAASFNLPEIFLLGATKSEIQVFDNLISSSD
jgi:hypothetical protein